MLNKDKVELSVMGLTAVMVFITGAYLGRITGGVAAQNQVKELKKDLATCIKTPPLQTHPGTNHGHVR